MGLKGNRLNKIRFSRVELALFLIPVLLVPAALFGNRWKVALTPVPTTVPTPTPTPIPNFFRGQGSSNQIPIASRDGKIIVTHPDSYSIARSPKIRFAVWNAKSGVLARRFGVFDMGIGNHAPILSPDGQSVLFPYGGYKGNLAVLLDVNTGRERRQWKKPESEGFSLALSNDFLATTSNDDVGLYSTKTGALIKKLRHRSRDYFPTNPQFSPDGKRICWVGFSNWNYDSYANGNSDNEVVCFDVATGRKVWNRAFPRVYIMQVRYSGDGRTLIVRGHRHFWAKSQKGNAISSYSQIWAFDATTGRQLWVKNARYGGNEIPVSPDGKWIALTLQDDNNDEGHARVVVCEARTGKERATFFQSFTEIFWSADTGQIWTTQNKRVVLQKDGSWSALPPNKPNVVGVNF